MMELYLSSLPTVMPSSVCACNLEQLSALSVSWLKYHIENSSKPCLGVRFGVMDEFKWRGEFEAYLARDLIQHNRCVSYRKIPKFLASLLLCDECSQNLD